MKNTKTVCKILESNRLPSLETLKKRLNAWKIELETNNNGMRQYAPRAIKLLEQQIEELESYTKR